MDKKDKKFRFPKINSINFGGPWIAVGLIVGLAVPVILWFVFHKVFWWLIAVGGIILLAFWIVLAIEMYQDNGKTPSYMKELKNNIPFDRVNQYAVIKSSICTGEKVAGFKNIDDGHFTEVMVIRTVKDEEMFKQVYGISEIKKEY